MNTNSSGETMPKLIHDYREDHLRRQEKFFQSVFLTSSTLLGILISLQPDIPISLCNHILRLCALFLLCISCLLDAILLYGIANHSLTVAHHLEKLLNNPDLWQKTGRFVSVPIPKWILNSRYIVLSAFLLSLILLALSSVFK